MANIKKINFVLETSDYDIFKTSDLNREIKEGAVNTLLESINKEGQRQPILVDKDYTVYDGQHRLEVCKMLGIPVKFIVDKTIEDNSIQQLNANQRAWTIQNHVDFFCKKGNNNYIILKRLRNESQLNIGILSSMLMGISSGSQSTKHLKAGTFIAKKYELVKRFLKDYTFLKNVCPSNGHSVDSFVAAIWEVWKLEKFDLERFLNKNKTLPEQAQGIRDKNVMLKMILENYNKGFKGDSENKVNYYFDEKQNVVLNETERF